MGVEFLVVYGLGLGTVEHLVADLDHPAAGGDVDAEEADPVLVLDLRAARHDLGLGSRRDGAVIGICPPVANQKNSEEDGDQAQNGECLANQRPGRTRRPGLQFVGLDPVFVLPSRL